MHWLTCAILATLGISPVMILTGVAQRNFGIASDVTAALWMGGVTLGIIGWIVTNGRGSELITLSPMLVSIFIFSLVVGAAANILLFQALVSAPNPGLVLGVLNTNALLAFLLAPLLAYVLPQFFPSWEFAWQHGIGIVMVVTGLGLITAT